MQFAAAPSIFSHAIAASVAFQCPGANSAGLFLILTLSILLPYRQKQLDLLKAVYIFPPCQPNFNNNRNEPISLCFTNNLKLVWQRSVVSDGKHGIQGSGRAETRDLGWCSRAVWAVRSQTSTVSSLPRRHRKAGRNLCKPLLNSPIVGCFFDIICITGERPATGLWIQNL